MSARGLRQLVGRPHATGGRNMRSDLCEHVTPSFESADVRVAEPYFYVEVPALRGSLRPKKCRKHRSVPPDSNGPMAVLLVRIDVLLLPGIIHQVSLPLYVSGRGDQDVVAGQQPLDGRRVVPLHSRLELGVERGNVVAADRCSGGERAGRNPNDRQNQQDSRHDLPPLRVAGAGKLTRLAAARQWPLRLPG